MRLTIVPEDNFIRIDGDSINFDFTSLIDPTIHAVQWYGNKGQIEFKNTEEGEKPQNQFIENMDQFTDLINQAQTLIENRKIVLEKASNTTTSNTNTNTVTSNT